MQSYLKTPLEAFFCEGTLSEKTVLASQIKDTRDIQSLMTPVPWNIAYENLSLDGFSENMHFAIQDILSHLVHLGRTVSPETKVHVRIDGTKLRSMYAKIAS